MNKLAFLALVTALLGAACQGPTTPATAGTAASSATAAPARLTAAASSGQVVLSWDAVPAAGGYNLYRSQVSGVLGPKLNAAALSASGYTDTNVSNGTTYYYSVTALCSGVESAASTQASALPQAQVAGVPGGVSAVSANSQVTVSWNSVNGAAGYNIWRSTVHLSQGTQLNSSAVTALSYTDTTAVNGTTYYYSVTSLSAGGESVPSAQAMALAHIPAAGAPTGVSASGGNGQITVSWNPVSGATSYNVYYQVTSGVTIGSATKVAGATSPCTISGLADAMSYYVIVASANAGGETASNEVSTSTNPTFTLLVGAAPGGTVSPSGTFTVYSGTPTAITATPAAGYAFAYWSATGATVIANTASASTTVTLTAGNADVAANFVAQ